MSDTTEADTDPNFSAQRITAQISGGREAPAIMFTFGPKRRAVTIADLSLGDQFDLVELAGENSDNTRWMLMAGIAYALVDIDGLPVARPNKRNQIKANLERLGDDGIHAYMKAVQAMANAETTESAEVSAKN